MYKIQFSKPDIALPQQAYEEIKEIVASGWVCEGKWIEKLQNHFIDKFGVKYAIACANCTSGLVAAVKALDLKKKKVGLPAFTWPSTLYAIECGGAKPIFIDINPKTWLMNQDYIKFLDAIIPVDVFGSEFIPEACPSKIIIDAAYGYGNPNLGKRGDIEVVSFSFTKVVTAMQGGMILTNDELLKDRAKEIIRLAAKMTEINALICCYQLDKFDSGQENKTRLINMYKKYIECNYTCQEIPKHTNNSVFSILLPALEKRDRIVELFTKNNVEVKCYYKPLVNTMKDTNWVYERIISLPVYKEVEEYIPFICKLINEA